MAKKEPLYPHVPKGKEVQFPHTTVKVKDGELQLGQVVPSMDRDEMCKWFNKQRELVDKLIDETEYDGQERGFAICLKTDGSLHSELKPVSREFFPYIAPVNCPKGEERVGDFHTHPEDAEGRHRSFSASDYGFALGHNLQVQCLAYRWKDKNYRCCLKVYPELVMRGPQAINLIAQHSVLGALGKAMDMESEVEDEKRQWSDYNDAVMQFEQIARIHHVFESCSS